MTGREAIRLVTGSWERLGTDAAPVRVAVFVDEQGIPAELEWDAEDALSLHCVAYLGERPVATGRLLRNGHIGRMAVLREQRGAGLGSRVLAALVDAAAARGDREVALSAQVPVLGFYRRHGFVAEGEVYDEVGIPHQAMRRALAPQAAKVDRPAAADGRNAACARDALPATHPVVDTFERRMDDGAVLRGRDWRPGGAARGGILLLHGLGEHSGRYDALARWLCARGWRVRAHDHVGHGLSSGRRGTIATPDQLLRHAQAEFGRFASDLGARPVLLGHSLGGALAAELVADRGLEVSGLVLSSPALDAGLGLGQRALASVLGAVAPSLPVSNGLDPEQISRDPTTVAAYRGDPLVHDRVSARLVLWLVGAGNRALAAAPRLTVPTLMLVSGADRLVDPEGSRRFHARAPAGRVTLHWYPALRHEVFNEIAEDRRRVLDDLGHWLDALDRAR